MPQRQQIGRNGTITKLRRLVPVSQLLQGFRQILCKRAGHSHTGFQIEALDLEDPLLAMGLGIHPAHQLATMQQGQHEVTVLTLGGRGIALDTIVKVEQLTGPFAIPHQRIERRQDGGMGCLEMAFLCLHQLIGQRGVHKSAVLPPLHPYRQQLPLVRQLMEQGVIFAAPQPVVIRHPASFDQPQRPAAGAHHILLRLLDARQIPLVAPLGDNPLGQVIDPLKVAPLPYHQLTGGKQHLQMALLRFPVPPAIALAGCAFKVGRPHRTMLANTLDQLANLLLMGSEPVGRKLPAHGGGVKHPVAQQPVILAGHKAGLVGPIFEDLAVGQQLLQPTRFVLAKAAKEHQIGAARHHRDGIDLQQRHAANGGQQIGRGRLAATGDKQPLRRQLQMTGILQ